MDIANQTIDTSVLSADSVIITEAAARRLQADVGDDLHIGLSSQTFRIQYIIPDAELPVDTISIYAAAMQNSMYGTLYFDTSAIPLVFELVFDIGDMDIRNVHYVSFFMDGDIESLRTVESDIIAIARNNGRSVGRNEGELVVSYSDDLMIRLNRVTIFEDGIMMLFTFICWFAAMIGLIQYLYIRTVNNQKDLLVLKTLGMTNIKFMFYFVFEIMLFIVPVTLLGIGLGYLIVEPIGGNTYVYGFIQWYRFANH